MYAILNVRWVEIKNCEKFTRTYEGEKGNVTYIDRAIVDWSTKTIYTTKEKAEPKIYEDEEWLELGIIRVYGPYGTEASVKTALSKIKAELRSRK